MRTRAGLVAALTLPALMFAWPLAVGHAEETTFFLQGQGKVQVIRGLDPNQGFETAKPEEEVEAVPAPAAETPPRPTAAGTPSQPKYTRQNALARVQDRGIRVIRAGVRSQGTTARSGQTRQRALERLRQRGSPAD
jgi:hypothetical protein